MQLNLLKRLDRIGLNTVWGKLEKAGTCGDSQATAPAGGGGITARRWWQARNSQNKLFKRWRKAGSTRTCVSRQERSAYGQKFRDSPRYCVCGATWKPSCKTGSRLKSDHTHAGLLPFLLVIGPEPGLIRLHFSLVFLGNLQIPMTYPRPLNENLIFTSTQVILWSRKFGKH